MARVAKRKEEVAKPKITFDVPLLNVLIKYARCEYVSHQQLHNLYQFLRKLDMDSYRYQKDIYDRLDLLKALTKCQIEDNVTDDELLIHQVGNYVEANDSMAIFHNVGLPKNQLTQSEVDVVSNAINERLQYLAIFSYKDRIMNLMERIDGSSYETSYVSLMKELQDIFSTVLMELQNSGAEQGLLKEFSFCSDNYASLLNTIVSKSKRPTSVLQTGIRQLNAILSPGFQSGRFYLILGGSGKFKSGTLLNLTDQIRKFNPQIVPYENGRRKCILFVTLENSIEETVERIYDMYSDLEDDIRDKTTAEVAQTFRDKGQFTFTQTSGIDIEMRYYGNLEIDTSHLYTLVRELNDRGKEPIAIVLDYVKRIDSVHNSKGDERVRLSYVGKELKNIAQYYEIPVISAMQLNREGNGIIDAAMRENKEDVTRFVGASNIGNCWDLIEDADWVAVINLEYSKSRKQLYLTWKRLKIRGKKDPTAADYFNHPFVNMKNIRLETDVDKDEVLSIVSIASDLESIQEKEEDNKSKGNGSLKKIGERRSEKVTNLINAIPLSNIVA